MPEPCEPGIAHASRWRLIGETKGRRLRFPKRWRFAAPRLDNKMEGIAVDKPIPDAPDNAAHAVAQFNIAISDAMGGAIGHVSISVGMQGASGMPVKQPASRMRHASKASPAFPPTLHPPLKIRRLGER